jgi:hypothetical protein
MIQNNGLVLTPATQTQIDNGQIPSGWSTSGYMSWSGDGNTENRRITAITIQSASVSGAVDLTALTALSVLEAYNNTITSINLSGLGALQTVHVSLNQLTTLDIRTTGARDVQCDNNLLTTLLLPASLQTLIADGNQLGTVDLSMCTSAVELGLPSCQLTSVKLPNTNTLTKLRLGNNYLTSLDVTQYKNLAQLNIQNNKLTYIDISKSTVAYGSFDFLGDGQTATRTAYWNGAGWQAYVKFYTTPTNLGSTFSYDAKKGLLICTSSSKTSTQFEVTAGKTNKYLSGTVSITYTSNPPRYNIGDIETINRLITENGLTWTVEDMIDLTTLPDDWTGATWTNVAYDKRITNLDIKNSEVTGDADISGLTELLTLDASNNHLTGLDLRHNTNLASFDGTNQTCSLKLYPTAVGGPWEVYVRFVNPTGIAPGLTYDTHARRLRAPDTSIASSPFTTETGKAGWTLSGTLYLDYAASNAVPTYNIGDMMIINRLITRNGLDLTPATASQLATGSGIPTDWESSGITSWSTEVMVNIRDTTLLMGASLQRGGDIAVTGLEKLRRLTWTSANATTLEAAYCDSLREIRAGRGLTALDVTGCSHLQKLFANGTTFTEFDVSTCPQLQTLVIKNHRLTSIDLSQNPLLVNLEIDTGMIVGTLDLRSFMHLTYAMVNNNKLREILLPNSSVLRGILAKNNQLTAVDLSTYDTGTYEFTLQKPSRTLYWNADSNRYDLPISLRNPTTLNSHFKYEYGRLIANDKLCDTTTFKVETGHLASLGPDAGAPLSGVLYITFSDEPYTPDYNPDDIAVINRLIEHNGLGWALASPADGSYCPSDWTGVTWSSDAHNKRITALDLSGLGLRDTVDIRGLTELTSLDVSGNQLHLLDLSANTALETLDVSGNALLYLNLKKNTALTSFAGSGQTVAIEMWPTGASGTPPYEYYVGADSVTELQGGLTYAYKRIHAADNSVSQSTFRSTTGKPGMALSGILNPITYGATTPIYNIGDMMVMNEIITNNGPVYNLVGSTGPYTLATAEQLANGATVPDTWKILSWSNVSYNKRVIKLDDPTSTITYITFSQQNDLDVTALPELYALAWHSGNVVHLNAAGCSQLDNVGRLDITDLESVDFSGCTALSILTLDNLPLTEIDLSDCSALKTLELYKNKLTSLDLSNNTQMTSVVCYSNLLTDLKLPNTTTLTTLSCYDNQLTSLDVSKNTGITTLQCYKNQLADLDATANTALTVLDCYQNVLTELKLPNTTTLRQLLCYSNKLTELDVSKYTGLTSLRCDTNQLAKLDVSANTLLTVLHCRVNLLHELDLTNNTALTNYYGTSQKPALTMYLIPSTGKYSAPIALNTPNTLPAGFSYADGILTANNSSKATMAFTVQTNLSGFTLAGSLQLTYDVDNIPPTLTDFEVTDLSNSRATFHFTVSEAAHYYCLLLDPSDPAPSASVIKAQGTALAKASGMALQGVNSFIINDLSPYTSYKAYIVAEDFGENFSSVESLSFSTLAPIPIGIESSAATVAGGITTGDVVYFGRYPQTLITDVTGLTENIDYKVLDGLKYKIEPVAWRALSNSGGKLLLVAAKGLDCHPFDTIAASTVRWETAEVRQWLNGSFYGTAFTANEQSAVLLSTIQNADNMGGSMAATQDKVFMLSLDEASNAAYGFAASSSDSPTRAMTRSDYAIAQGANSMWWLRTTTANGMAASLVHGSSGEIYANVFTPTTATVAVRPAIYVDATMALFTSNASGYGAKSSAEVGGEIKGATASASEVKLTITAPTADLDLTISDTSPVVGVTDNTLTFNYSDAVVGDGKSVSMAMLNTADSVLYYGRLADCSVAGSSSGTVSVPLTMFLTPGYYTIRLFEEQVNGDGFTDFTSAPVDIPMTFSPVYNITYDLNGGTLGTPNFATYTPSMTADIPVDNSPTLANCGFGGWLFTSDEAGVSPWVGKAILKGAYGNLTAVAQWDTVWAYVDSVFIYNGMEQEPDPEDIIVFCGDSVMTLGTDFSYTLSNNTDAGWAYIHISTGVSARFTGTPTDSFTIHPRQLTGYWDVAPKAYLAGDRTATVTFVPDNVVVGDDVSVSAASAEFVSPLVDTAAVVIVHTPVLLSGVDVDNYAAPDTVPVLKGLIYPWRFIHAGRWTDGWCWDGYAQTAVMPLAGSDVVVSIEDDCYFDAATGVVGTLTVAAGKSFTIAPASVLELYDTLLLHHSSTFVKLGTLQCSKTSYCAYIDTLAEGRNWYLSAPVTGWSLSSALAPAGSPGGTLRVSKQYDEPQHQWVDLTTAPASGVGLLIQSETEPLAVAFEGGLEFGNVTVPLTNTIPDLKHGFNLIGNPFAAYWRLTGDAVYAAGIYSTMWYRTYSTVMGYEFVAYNANGTVSAAPGWENASTSAELGFIPPMQSFWVRMRDTIASGTFTFDYGSVFASGNGNRLRSERFTELHDFSTELHNFSTELHNFQNLHIDDLQENAGTTSLRGTKQSTPDIGKGEQDAYTPPVIDVLVRIDVAKTDTTAVDQMVLYATKDAKQDFDDFDSEKMTEGADKVRIYTTVTDTLSTGKTTERDLCIDGRPAIKVGDIIPIVFYASYAGEFMLRVSEFRGCDTLAVWFVDHLANKEYKLNGGDIYYFSSRSGEVAERFTLEFRTAPVSNEVVANGNFFAWGSAPGTISVRGASVGDKVEVYDMLGRLVRTSSDVDRITEFSEFTGLKAGIYFVRCGNESVKVIVKN